MLLNIFLHQGGATMIFRTKTMRCMLELAQSDTLVDVCCTGSVSSMNRLLARVKTEGRSDIRHVNIGLDDAGCREHLQKLGLMME